MCSLLLRPKASAAGYSLLRCISARILRSPDFFDGKLGARMMSSVNSADEPPSWTLPSRISPYLTLPPAFEGGQMVYNFYSLVEDRVVSQKKRGGGGGEEESVEMPDDDALLVGSSHGWLALFNQRNNDLFLSNPLTRRHIKLPPIDKLPDPEINLRDGHGSISKVIISCSPDEEECRAIMTFGPGDRLAFCLPRRSTRWNPLGKLFFRKYTDDLSVNFLYGRAYEDIVYCNRRKVFFCITQFAIGFDLGGWYPGYPTALDEWCLRHPGSPTSCVAHYPPMLSLNCDWVKQNMELLKSCRQISYLVCAEQYDQLFIVVRFVMQQNSGPKSWFFERSSHDPNNARDIDGGRLIDMYPYQTIGFSVFKFEWPCGTVPRLRFADSLDGLTMFIGTNHSFVMSAAQFPELNLKSNSIYFTDANRHRTPAASICSGHDIGIFDYENKTLSPFYYPCDVQSIDRNVPPMWFTPSL